MVGSLTFSNWQGVWFVIGNSRFEIGRTEFSLPGFTSSHSEVFLGSFFIFIIKNHGMFISAYHGMLKLAKFSSHHLGKTLTVCRTETGQSLSLAVDADTALNTLVRVLICTQNTIQFMKQLSGRCENLALFY